MFITKKCRNLYDKRRKVKQQISSQETVEIKKPVNVLSKPSVKIGNKIGGQNK